MGCIHNVISLLFLLFFAPSNASLAQGHIPLCFVTPPDIFCSEWLFQSSSVFFFLWGTFSGHQLFWRVIISGVNAAESSKQTVKAPRIRSVLYIRDTAASYNQWGSARRSTKTNDDAMEILEIKHFSRGMFMLKQSLVCVSFFSSKWCFPLSFCQR